MTHDESDMYDIWHPLSGHEAITIGDKCRLNVEYIGSADIMFHEFKDERVTLIDVSYIPGLGFNLFSVHAATIRTW